MQTASRFDALNPIAQGGNNQTCKSDSEQRSNQARQGGSVPPRLAATKAAMDSRNPCADRISSHETLGEILKNCLKKRLLSRRPPLVPECSRCRKATEGQLLEAKYQRLNIRWRESREGTARKFAWSSQVLFSPNSFFIPLAIAARGVRTQIGVSDLDKGQLACRIGAYLLGRLPVRNLSHRMRFSTTLITTH